MKDGSIQICRSTFPVWILELEVGLPLKVRKTKLRGMLELEEVQTLEVKKTILREVMETRMIPVMRWRACLNRT